MSNSRSNAPTLEIGSTLGNFRLTRLLGEGGMGVVFLAEDLKLGRQVALKVMQPRMGDQASIRARFVREARSASLLEHERIVRVYHVDEDRGVLFIAMELLRGESLDRYLNREPIPSLRHSFKIALHIAQGLAIAHRKGLIHRDVKPSNVWMEQVDTKTGFRCKLLDFGLARAASGDSISTHSGKMMGTPAYMSPEQWQGKGVDHRSDLFSLGVVMYQMLTGSFPFGNGTPIEIARSIALDEPIAPAQMNNRVPVVLSDLTMQMLEKNKEHRPMNAEEVIARLEAFAEQRPADASKWSTIQFGMDFEASMEGETFGLDNQLPTPHVTPGSYRTAPPPLPTQTPHTGFRYVLLGVVLSVVLIGIGILLASLLNRPADVVKDDGKNQKLVENNKKEVEPEKKEKIEPKKEEEKKSEEKKTEEKKEGKKEEEKKIIPEEKKTDPQEEERKRLEQERLAREKKELDRKQEEARKLKEFEAQRSQLLAEGKQALDSLKIDEAIKAFNQVIKLDPKSGLAYTSRALAQGLRVTTEEAVVDADRGIELAPNSGFAYAVRAYLHLDLRLETLALADAKRAVQLEPKLGMTHAILGNIFAQKGERVEAFEAANRGVTLEKSPLTYLFRGNCHAAAEEHGEALKDYNLAIQLEPRAGFLWAQRSYCYYLQYDTERALADVDQAIQFDSKQSFPYHVRGLIFQDRKDFDKAIADYTITIEKCSEQYSSAYQDRAKCYQSRNLPQDQDRAKTDFEKARRLLQSRVDRDPKSALLLVDRADYYMDRDDFINALTDCNAAISLNPKQISAYNLRALVRTDRTDGLRNDSELEKAIQDASKCIEMAPKATVFRTTRARIYFFHSEPTKCIDDCDFAIKLNSNNWLAYNLRGLARQDLVVTDHPRSLEDFNKSIQLNPYEAQLYANRGEQNVLMKQFREAATDYRQAVKLRPRDMRFHTELCLALYDGGSFADCVLACDAAVRVDPKSHSLFHLRGLARNKATPNKLDEVIADMDEAIRLNDRIAGYFADRGTFYFHKKDYKKATTDCNEAIRLDPNDAGAYNVRALCLYESGSDDWKSMLADYDKAIQLKPQNIIFLRNRALAYETRNEPGDAARARADRDKADEIEDKKK